MSTKSLFSPSTVSAWRGLEAVLSDLKAASSRLSGGRAGFVSAPRGLGDAISMRGILRSSWKTNRLAPLG